MRAFLIALAMAALPMAAQAQDALNLSNTAPILANYVGETGGTGKYPARAQAEPKLPGHTLYRPVDLPRGKKLPIIAWGNGACVDNGRRFEVFLREISSHGYLILALGPPRDTPPRVVAPVAGGPPAAPSPTGPERGEDPTKPAQLIEAIDWAIAENARKDGPLYRKLDPKKVAVMGQSCGGLQALAVSDDPRIKTSVIWNSGIYERPGGRSGVRIDKTKLATLHAPIAYFIGGPGDIAYPNANDDFARITTVPVFMANLDVGHGGTYSQPNGGPFGEVAVKWLDWRLKGAPAASKWFVGSKCVLCVDPKWTVRKKAMK